MKKIIGELFIFLVLAGIVQKVTFPMHQGGGGRFYEKFAQQAQQRGARTQVVCAKKQGDRFFYQRGKIK